MATFVSTVQLTEQGATNVKNTCERANAFKVSAEQMGVEVRDIYWTLGAIDGFVVFDAPDDATASAAMLHLTSFGYVKTQTCRAYNAAEMEQIIANSRPANR